MAVSESNMAEFRMAAIIKLSQSEWVKFFLHIVGTNLGKCEWVWEGKLRWLNANWQNSRLLPSSSWVRMNEFESDWISLSQSQNWERMFLSESEIRKQDGWMQDGSVSESNMAEFKMVAIIKLSENESIKFFCAKWQNSRWLPSSSWVRMNEWKFSVHIVGTNLGKCEWVWEGKLRWLNANWENSRLLPSSN